jgi:putative ABC transport system permease protein
LSIFAGVALILAAVGVYSIMAYFVTQRTREIGIRMALGADRNDILSFIVRHGMFLVIVGLALGVGVAMAATRLIAKLLYGVTTTDLITFTTIVLLLGVIGLAAILIPARRATKVDPINALRQE